MRFIIACFLLAPMAFAEDLKLDLGRFVENNYAQVGVANADLGMRPYVGKEYIITAMPDSIKGALMVTHKDGFRVMGKSNPFSVSKDCIAILAVRNTSRNPEHDAADFARKEERLKQDGWSKADVKFGTDGDSERKWSWVVFYRKVGAGQLPPTSTSYHAILFLK